ncbi:hypothetical protein [Mesorhizobium sp. M4B.F.Ca.ET.214.01.1.1]|uniref:hypothetical protein n=1 Tax=Mesorhizobium sp. M4B.F.Ca.ET.214.01.1.1 TaxID=2563955 RepID=UPI001093C733|nr:hypothetical protein [Mesorhizobium sp. M4B.F.Ca.ET.214.01.1.1]TGQ35335.1 hypothetical protein EN857_19845 [Mesorhizobium sp. M4B.F.Ca.ET.214.01.1.1]
MSDVLVQIDAQLCEDRRTVWLYGYTADDACYLQAFPPLPIEIDEENFLRDEWEDAARHGRWRPFP